jgi:hypothetical protein
MHVDNSTSIQEKSLPETVKAEIKSFNFQNVTHGKLVGIPNQV